MVTEATPKRKRALEDPATSSSKKKQQQQRRKPDFSNPGDTVKFLIGNDPSPKPFVVHKEHACYYSPVLDAAFNSGFVEGQTQTYTLDDVSPRAFRILVRWLYTQALDVSIEQYEEAEDDDDDGPADIDTASEHEEEVTDDERLEINTLKMGLDLIHLWVMADRLLIRPLQNSAIDILEKLWSDPPVAEWSVVLSYIYENTTPSSPLRHLLVDMIAYLWSSDEMIDNFPDNIPKQLLLDVLKIHSNSVFALFVSDSQGRRVATTDECGKQAYTCVRSWRSYHVPEDDPRDGENDVSSEEQE
ncbi:hypothetical protein BDZ45DRAFT_735942 [Acephala macrosclerotiorum]|nr:hypothetical protein BDZ45DRAFT_735942 [Acephala macrosclerotiorum]